MCISYYCSYLSYEMTSMITYCDMYLILNVFYLLTQLPSGAATVHSGQKQESETGSHVPSPQSSAENIKWYTCNIKENLDQ